MRRIRLRLALPSLLALLALSGLLLIAAPVAAQDGTTFREGRVRVAIDGDLTLAAGDTAEVVVVVDGTAIIEGTATVVTVVDGDLTVAAGASVGTIAIIHGTADVQAGSTITQDVLKLDSTVTIDPGATFDGEIHNLAEDFAGIGLALGVLGIIAWVAFSLLTWIAGLALAAFGARQVRTAEWLISREPGKVFLAGLAMVFLPPLVAMLMMATVVLIPVGLVLLLIVWPVLAFLGWLVGATWMGEWVLRVAGRDAPERRPYLGVTVGLICATLASLIPVVGGIISLFGTGAIALAGWRMLRTPEPPRMPPMAPYPPMGPYPPAGPMPPPPPYGG